MRSGPLLFPFCAFNKKAVKNLHQNTNAMFTQLFGSKATCLTYLQYGLHAFGEHHGKRRVAKDMQQLLVAQQRCQFPDRASFWIFCVVENGGLLRMKQPKDHLRTRVQELNPEKKKRKRFRNQDNRLAKALPDMPGTATPGKADPPRASGPYRDPLRLLSPDPPPGALERVRTMVADLQAGKPLKGWAGHHVAMALTRAQNRAASQ